MPGTGNTPELLFRIGGEADVRVLVQSIPRHGVLAGVSEIDRSLIATIVSELASNIVKYAGRGTLRVCRAERADALDIDIWAEDSGAGIADLELAVKDHFSTGGTLGLGLPGVKRMADSFWIRSDADQGTLVFARKTVRMQSSKDNRVTAPVLSSAPMRIESEQADGLHYSIASRPYQGNPYSGDMARVMAVDGGWLAIIIDASGHGRAASEVAQHALEVMGRNATSQVESIFLRVHDALKGSGGAAVGVMFLDDSSSMLRYAGVGNTRAMKTGSAGEWVGISRDGVLGNRLPNLHIQETAMAPGDLIVLWTDGVSDFEVRKLATKNAFKAEEEIAKMIVSQLAKPYDDACCLTLRWR